MLPAAVEPSMERARLGLGNRLRHLLGLRQTFRVGPVRYREVTSDSLRQALSRAGDGFKEFDAHFADGASMRLRCTRERIYADLAGPRLAPVYKVAEPFLRPGMRVLIPRGGTGYPGAWAAGRVAPSGAVVSLEADTESVEYAQHRYRLPNASFERGGLEAVAGETDGAFGAVLLVEPLAPIDDEDAMNRELWRLVRPGGWLVSAARRPAAELALALSRAISGPVGVLSDVRDGWAIVKADRPQEPGRDRGDV